MNISSISIFCFFDTFFLDSSLGSIHRISILIVTLWDPFHIILDTILS